jgi:hypothetical protein
VQVHFLLHAGDRLDAAGGIDLAFAGDDALGRRGDGLQAGRTETVDVMPAVVTGQPPRSAIWRAMLAPVAPSGIGAAHEHVLDFARLDAGARDGGLQRVAAQVAPWVMLKAPFHDLARPVRAVDTMTASSHAGLLCISTIKYDVRKF